MKEGKETLGTYLRQVRKEKGYTLDSLAKLVGVSSSYLSLIERNLRVPKGLNHYQNLATALNLSVVELLNLAGLIQDEDPIIIEKEQTKTLVRSLTESKRNLINSVDGLSEKTISYFYLFLKHAKNELQAK